ncbi:hypothetical protein TNCT_511411 [Trichonephila clavata]|uniref:Uncharacterized protein n=1 Tax=Trichonephila clavata TaxID=2740835 RepID=A0A8X6M367_TRICU|nr:hypothetical protein TNCT_511411 [Trichonephila clavata]
MTTRRPLPFERTPLGFREAFEDSTWFCTRCTRTKDTACYRFPPQTSDVIFDPTVDRGFRIRTELTQAVSKKEQNTSILRSLALETIDTMYPEPDWVHIITGESLLKDSDSAGAGVNCHLFFFNLTTEKFTTAFYGEVAALEIALAQLHCHPNSFTGAVVFCDSKAAILL